MEPWEKIPDHYWDQVAVKMWHHGHTNREIGNRVSVDPRTVTNRLCALRKLHGTEIVPFNDQRRNLNIEKTQKSHDIE